MKKHKSMRNIVPATMVTIVLMAMIFLFYGASMIYKSIKPVTRNYKDTAFDNYIDRTQIYNNIFIDDTYTNDSIYGRTFKSELYCAGEFYNPKTKFLGEKFDLINNKNARKILLFFTVYYTLITVLWLMVFYNLFMFVTSHNIKLFFFEKNEQRLRNSGRLVGILAMFKIFGIQVFSMMLYYGFNTYVNNPDYDYSTFTGILILCLFGGLLKVLSIAYKNGFMIQNEQDLTV